MKLSKPTKSNSQYKVLRMIARNEQLERFDGKFVAMNRKYKDRSKYNRKDAKRELRRDLRGSYCIYTIVTVSYKCFSTIPTSRVRFSFVLAASMPDGMVHVTGLPWRSEIVPPASVRIRDAAA